jgi:hypothetical protein
MTSLCCFLGASFPFNVRRVDGSDASALIGDAWIYDVSEWDVRVQDSVRQGIVASIWPAFDQPLAAFYAFASNDKLRETTRL